MMIGIESGEIMALFLALVLFGIGYNALVGCLERAGYVEGYMALVVALGVGITLGAVAVVNWQAALLSLGAFTASGVPMIVGSIARHVEQRRKGEQARRDEVGDVS